MNPIDLDDKVAAAAIAAAGTVIGALIQLRIAWRKEVSERARGIPVSKRSRRGPVVAVGILLIAAAVGGFALSEYLMGRLDRESAAVRGELQMQLQQISSTAERLERATLRDRESAGRGAADRTGAAVVAVVATVGPCRARVGDGVDLPGGCAESEALRVTLCASVPSSATVTDTILYVRPEESREAWNEHRVAVGEDAGRARFADKPYERADADQAKQICAVFATWDGEHAYSARLAASYVSAPAAGGLPSVALVPASGLTQ